MNGPLKSIVKYQYWYYTKAAEHCHTSRKVPVFMEAGFMNTKLPLFAFPPPVPVVVIYQQASHCLTTKPWQCFSFALKEQWPYVFRGDKVASDAASVRKGTENARVFCCSGLRGEELGFPRAGLQVAEHERQLRRLSCRHSALGISRDKNIFCNSNHSFLVEFSKCL